VAIVIMMMMLMNVTAIKALSYEDYKDNDVDDDGCDESSGTDVTPYHLKMELHILYVLPLSLAVPAIRSLAILLAVSRRRLPNNA